MIYFPVMPVMPENLCDVCVGEGRGMCLIKEYRDRVLAMLTDAKERLAVTPSPYGGTNADLVTPLEEQTSADFVHLPAEAKKRGCTVLFPE